MVNRKQCNIPWHVDDLKISHVDNKVVIGIIDKVSKEFEKEKSLTE